jgi:hypothetical protein
MIHRKLPNHTHKRSSCSIVAVGGQDANLSDALVDGIERTESFVKDDWVITPRYPQWKPDHAALEGEAINLFTIGLRPFFQHVLILLGIRSQHDLTVMGEPLTYLKLRKQELLKPVQVGGIVTGYPYCETIVGKISIPTALFTAHQLSLYRPNDLMLETPSPRASRIKMRAAPKRRASRAGSGDY